jgi:fructose-specific phosphotransferase system IIC component
MRRISPIKGRQVVAQTCFVLFAASNLASCARAPAVDIVGSFFPGWLVCLVPGILLTVLVQQVLKWRGMRLSYPVLVYPCLTALLTFVTWLLFFH